jgi:hypothetical protein
MRLRYGELSLEEQVERARVCERIDELWQLVQRGYDERAVELAVELDERLQLFVERAALGAAPDVQLSPLEASAWPLAELVMELAPNDLDGSLSLGRSAVPLEQALIEVESDHGVALSRASLRAGFSRGHLLEITLGVPGGSGAENEQIAAEDLVRAVLGDRLFETWVGAVHVSAEPRSSSLRVLDVRAPRVKLHVQELYDTVAAAARGVLSGLPERSYAERAVATSSAEWTMLEVEPLADAPPGYKEDLVLASTCTPELLRCFLDGAPCSSRRFSRVGESFLFLSYPDASRDMKSRVARRTVIESELAGELSDIAAVTGVGLGAHSTYVDFALCNLETGLPRLIAKLRSLALPRDSFVAFVDSELCDEWVPI